MTNLVKPHITNQLEKCGLPSALQLCLKMVLKAPAIDHKTMYQGDVGLVLKN